MDFISSYTSSKWCFYWSREGSLWTRVDGKRQTHQASRGCLLLLVTSRMHLQHLASHQNWIETIPIPNCLPHPPSWWRCPFWAVHCYQPYFLPFTFIPVPISKRGWHVIVFVITVARIYTSSGQSSMRSSMMRSLFPSQLTKASSQTSRCSTSSSWAK